MADLFRLPTYGKKGCINAIVETPKNWGQKLKYEPKLGTFTIARPLVLGVVYPYDWGFIPNTKAEDGDPLDAMIVYDGSTFPGFLLECRPLGVVKIAQKESGKSVRERNDRVILVPNAYPRSDHLRNVTDLPKRQRDELEEFFAISVTFTGKKLKKLGWGSADEALKVIARAARNKR